MHSYLLSSWRFTFSLRVLFWCFFLLLRASLSSRAIVSSFQLALFLLHQWFINFFRFYYLFSCIAQSTIVSFPSSLLVWVFALLRRYCRRHCCRSRATLHHHRCIHAQGWWCFFLML